MGRRYPGSLVARVLVNKFYALQRQYRKPSNKPGKYDAAKAWFLKWEGPLVGGLILSGVAALGVKLYVVERLDDIERRHERRQFYEGSCMMVGAHLAAIQSSLLFWRGMVAYAEYECKLQEPWQQQQQQRTQLAAQQMQLWQSRVCAVCGADWPAVATLQQQQRRWRQGGEQQEQQQQQQQQDELVLAVEPHEGQGSVGQQEQWQQSKKQAVGIAAQQQQNQQQQQPELVDQQPVHQQQQRTDTQVEQQQQQHRAGSKQQSSAAGQDVPLALEQQQQQHWLSGQWNPLCWHAQRQLQSVQHWLLQEQQQLALQQVGLQLWEEVHSISQQQVRLLQQQQAQQQELLMAHAQQLRLWQSLQTRQDSWLNLGFHAPVLGDTYGAAKGWWDSRAAGDQQTGLEQQQQQQQQRDENMRQQVEQQHGALPLLQRVTLLLRSGQAGGREQQQQQQEQREVSQPGGLRALLRKVWASREQQQQQHSDNQEVGQAAAAVPCSKTRKRWHVAVRLWLPHWVPDQLEELDYEMTSKEFVQDMLAAAAAALDTPDVSEYSA